jgi:hypothetical protein
MAVHGSQGELGRRGGEGGSAHSRALALGICFKRVKNCLRGWGTFPYCQPQLDAVFRRIAYMFDVLVLLAYMLHFFGVDNIVNQTGVIVKECGLLSIGADSPRHYAHFQSLFGRAPE